MPSSLTRGLTSTRTRLVSDEDTAASVGSGELAVLATPRLLAWMENATCAALDGYLHEGEASVGTRMTIDHVKASPVGAEVQVAATVSYVDGRLVRYDVVATDADGVLVAQAEITRVVVDRTRFLGRLG